MSMKVLIAGGGIGGLTTALCCLKAGFEVIVFEQAKKLSEIGAGIQIGPNASRVMLALELDAAFGRLATQPAQQEMRVGKSNIRVFRSPLGPEAIVRYGAPYFLLHRADLIDILGDTLQERSPGALRLNSTVKAYRNTPEGVTLELNDGTSEHGDVLIAADGIHSVLRDQMLGADRPKFTGNIVWRAMVPATPRLQKLIPQSMCVWVGPERHCVTYWLRGASVLNFVGAVERDNWTKESWVESGPLDELKEDFGSWSTPIAAVVEAASDCTRGALFDRDPLSELVDDKVVLMGDAAHPMLPFLAQGAAMAVEDAWTLAQSLKDQPSIADALKSYEQKRLPRTSKVQMAARARMKSNHETTLLGQLKAYGPLWLKSRMQPQAFDARHRWLFNHDVVQAP